MIKLFAYPLCIYACHLNTEFTSFACKISLWNLRNFLFLFLISSTQAITFHLPARVDVRLENEVDVHVIWNKILYTDDCILSWACGLSNKQAVCVLVHETLYFNLELWIDASFLSCSANISKNLRCLKLDTLVLCLVWE